MVVHRSVARRTNDERMWLQIAEAMQPDLAYFTDPNQNFISDYFQALTQAGTSIGSVQGRLFMPQQISAYVTPLQKPILTAPMQAACGAVCLPGRGGHACILVRSGLCHMTGRCSLPAKGVHCLHRPGVRLGRLPSLKQVQARETITALCTQARTSSRQHPVL